MKKALAAYLIGAAWLLGIHRGYVALWGPEDPEPIIRTQTPAELLPPTDFEALSRGIIIPDGVLPGAVLENFCS